MKKWLVLMSVGVLALGIAGCGGSPEEDGSRESDSRQESESVPGGNESQGSDSQTGIESSGSSEESSVPDAGIDAFGGWTDEMQGAKDAVKEVLGENYWPDMMLEPDMLEASFGVSPDMYEDYMAEMCGIMTNVDTLVVIKAGEEQIQAAEDALNAYRDAKVSDTMQYPMNLGKIQASVVERHGSYVYFVQVGADTMDLETEDAVTHCQEANKSVIEALNKYFGVE